MDLLVCGMHRSGTSALSRLLARATARTLLDDPEWAIGHELPRVVGHEAELGRFDIVKSPRMLEVLPTIVDQHPMLSVLCMVRDPRDVWASIQQKVRAGLPTRMLDYHRLGVHAAGVGGFTDAYVWYCDQISGLAQSQLPTKFTACLYEEFFPRRLQMVAAAANWLQWDYDTRSLDRMAHSQLAPSSNKPPEDQGIRGPGRWVADLEESDVDRLAPALRAHDSLVERLLDMTCILRAGSE